MKNIKLYIAAMLIMASGIIFYACDLSTPATGSVSGRTLQNEKGINTLLVGAYAALDMQAISGLPWANPVDMWTWGTLAGGMVHKGSTSGDQAPLLDIAQMDIGASMGFLNNMWIALYEGVSRANAVLKVVDGVKGISDAEKTKIKAEARFLRGHFYFYLTKMWGKVPWIDETTTDLRQPNDKILWPQIVADFKFAYENLPETQSKIAKANKWAAAAYLGKTYLYMHKYSEAATILDQVISQGVTSQGVRYQLLDNFKKLFMATDENHSEVVFAVQFTGQDGSGTIDHSRNGNMLNFPYGGPTTCCGFYNPSQDMVNSYKTDANGLPITSVQQPFAYDDAPMVTSDRKIPSDQHFTPYQGNLDPRLDWTVGRRGLPYLDWGPMAGIKWVRDPAWETPYFGLKHQWWQKNTAIAYNSNEWAPGTGINYALIRFADVLLMAAEANAQTGNLDKARQLVNRVRGRVADDTYGAGWPSYKLNMPYAAAVVANKSAVTGVDAQPGDWVVVTDTKSTYQLLKLPASDINNWQEYKNANYKVSTYPAGSPAFASKEAALHAIHFERKLELALEGHRFFDLSRWGIAAEQLNHYYQYEGGQLGYPDVAGATFLDYHAVYPIPQKQIDLSSINGEPTLTQNSGY